MRHLERIDFPLLLSILLLTGVGIVIYSSALMGLLLRDTDLFMPKLVSQISFGLVLGFVALAVTSRIHYTVWRKWAFYIVLVAIGLNVLLFVPGIGVTHGGATRWLDFGFITFQPSEFLKIAFVIYFATWISGLKDEIHTFKYGLIPLVILLGISGGLLLAQPDTDTFVVLSSGLTAMFFASGGKIRHLAILFLVGAITLAGLIATRPYLQQRVKTFLSPGTNAKTTSYQAQQALIAVGSGGLLGRGFGQSVQKFSYLPEPIGDSIFAVAAEEFGFVGTTLILLLFLFFGAQGLRVASRVKDMFGKSLIVGVIVMFLVQSLINIGSMIGMVPLSGITLVFMSHGGTALSTALATVGILLNISRYQTRT